MFVCILFDCFFFVFKREDPLKKTIRMIILNAMLGITLRALNVYPIIYDLATIISLFREVEISRLQSRFYMTFFHTCALVESCECIQKLANLLYLTSLSTYFFFFYRFDNKFRRSFKRIFMVKRLHEGHNDKN